jgi:DNA-binding CsgD family transcriptional regulator
MVTPPSWPLIGREPIVSRARALLDAGAGGIVLAGEAGVGKSRIAAEILRLGDELGYATASTVGTQAAAEIPLGALSHLLPDLSSATTNVLAAARAALVVRAADRRLLLSVDDAHLLDNHSAALVLQLALTMPSFVVATIRSGEPVPDAVVALWKDGLAERVEVGPLDDASVEQVVANILGGAVGHAVTAAIVDRADGNPLVARELCLGGRDAGAIERHDGQWRLVGPLSPSARLVEVVAGRVEGLDSAERRGLDVVAHGEPLGWRAAQELATPDALLQLERRGLVVLREDGRRREVWLSHPFYGDVVRATAGAMLAASIKGSLARSAHAAGMRRRSDLIRVAAWQLEAGEGDADLLLGAARETYRARDMAGTARLAAGAWDIRPDAAAGYLLGSAMGYSGRHEEADAIFAAATQLASNDDDYARLVLAHSSVLSAGLGTPQAAIALLQTADAHVSSDGARTSLRAQRAHLLAFHGEIDEALALSRSILAIGRGPAVVVAAMAALIAYGENGEYQAAVELAEQVLPEHLRLWEAGAVVIPPELVELQGKGARVAMGELDAVATPASGGVPRAEAAASNRPVIVLRALHTAIAAILRGKPRQAEAILSVAAPTAADPLASSAQALAALAAAITGRGDEAAVALARTEELDKRANRTPSYLVDQARVWTLVACGRPAAARTVAIDAIDRFVVAHRWGAALVFTHDLARIGAPAEAVAALARIGDRVDGPLAAARRAHIEGLSRGSAELLVSACDGFTALGAELLAAEAAADCGRAARRAGDPRRATAFLRRAASLLARCEGARTPGVVMPDELTPLSSREREVAVLAATGLGSDEIAGRLFLSVRTVDNHLQHVYQKLGIGSRGQLAAAMGERQA